MRTGLWSRPIWLPTCFVALGLAACGSPSADDGTQEPGSSITPGAADAKAERGENITPAPRIDAGAVQIAPPGAPTPVNPPVGSADARPAPTTPPSSGRDGGVTPTPLPPGPPPGPLAPVAAVNPCATPTLMGAGTANVAGNKFHAASSLNYSNGANAFDGDIKTTTGAPTNRDGILAADLGAPASLFRSVVTFAGVTPQRYKLQGSQDGVSYADVLRVHNPNFVDERVLPKVSFRFVRVVVFQNSARGEDPNILPAVAEFEIYTRGSDAGSDCAPIVYPAPLDRKSWKLSSSAGGGQAAISSPQQGWIDPSGTIDGPDHWLVRAGASVGTWVKIDMGAPQTFNQIFLSFDHDPLREMRVFASDDGISWGEPVWMGTIVPVGGFWYQALSFVRQTKRYIKIESQFDTKGRYWGFWNISALDVPTQIGAEDNTNVAQGRPTVGSNSKNAPAAFDGNPMTAIDDADVLTVDLGAVMPLGRIDVNFGPTVDSISYRIATSNDGATWTQRQVVMMGFLFGQGVIQPVMANYSTRLLRLVFQPSHPHNVDVKQTVRDIAVYRAPSTQIVGRERL